MSSRVTIIARWETEGAEQVGWRLSRDARERRDHLRLELCGLVSAEVLASEGRAPTVNLVMPSADWWALVRAAAEARALGAERGPALTSAPTAAAPEVDLAWTALASDRPRIASQLAGTYEVHAGVLRRAVRRALTEGTDPLAAACSAALLARASLGLDPEAPEARDADARAMALAALLRGVLGGDDGAWRWMLEARPPALGGRTPIQALREGDAEAVEDVLGQSASGGYL